MVQCILENGKIIKFMEKDCILGLMVENSKDIGRIIICMDKGNIHGLMGDVMKGIMIKIKNMAMVLTSGFSF